MALQGGMGDVPKQESRDFGVISDGVGDTRRDPFGEYPGLERVPSNPASTAGHRYVPRRGRIIRRAD